MTVFHRSTLEGIVTFYTKMPIAKEDGSALLPTLKVIETWPMLPSTTLLLPFDLVMIITTMSMTSNKKYFLS